MKSPDKPCQYRNAVEARDRAGICSTGFPKSGACGLAGAQKVLTAACHVPPQVVGPLKLARALVATLQASEVDAFTISTSIRSFVEMVGGFAQLGFWFRAIG